MSSNPFAAYQESQILSASPLQLIHLAYEGAIEAVAEARRHLADHRIHQRARAITKVQRILTELQSSLDFKQGGDVSVQLERLYDYMQRRLTDANFKQIEPPLAEVQGLLETLDGAWKEIAAAETTIPASPIAEPPPTINSSFGYPENDAYTSGSTFARGPAYSQPENPLYGVAERAYSYTNYTL